MGTSTICDDVKNRPTLHDARSGGLSDVAADTKGSVFIALADGNLVQRTGPSGVVTTVAGSAGVDPACVPGPGCRGFAGDGGSASAARLDRPAALATTPRGDLYVLDSGNARVRFVNLGTKATRANGIVVAAGAIETVAGNGKAGSAGDGGQARNAELGGSPSDNFGRAPLSQLASVNRDGYGAYDAAREGRFAGGSLAIDGRGNLYLADMLNHRVRRVDASGVITTIAGDSAPIGMQPCCASPRGLTFDATGNLYVSDFDTQQVWVLNLGQGVISAFGQPVAPDAPRAVVGGGRGGTSGAATDASLNMPSGIVLDRGGTLYVTDLATPPEGGAVLKVGPDGQFSQLMGNGRSSFDGDGLGPHLTSLNLPTAVAVDQCGNLFVADPGNDRVRKLVSTTPCPVIAEAARGGRSPRWLVVAAVAGAASLAATIWRRRSKIPTVRRSTLFGSRG